MLIEVLGGLAVVGVLLSYLEKFSEKICYPLPATCYGWSDLNVFNYVRIELINLVRLGLSCLAIDSAWAGSP